MKPMVLQFMLEGLQSCTIIVLRFIPQLNIFTKNVSIGQLLQYIPNSIAIAAKKANKTIQQRSLSGFIIVAFN